MVAVKIPARVDVANRVVEHIAIAVKGLRVEDLGHKGIGADEPPQLRIIVPPAVVKKPALAIELLAGKANEPLSASLRSADLPPGIVLD